MPFFTPTKEVSVNTAPTMSKTMRFTAKLASTPKTLEMAAVMIGTPTPMDTTPTPPMMLRMVRASMILPRGFLYL